MPYKLNKNYHRPKDSHLPFKSMGSIEYQDFCLIFDFAYNMVFGKGHHRSYRSGGTQQRNPILKFKDVFEGKIGEFAIYRFFLNQGINIGYPDLSIASKGVWDAGDFAYNNLNISVKSSKHFAQMLLLESQDYIISDNEVIYSPDKTKYDIILLTRVKTNLFDSLSSSDIENNTDDLKNALFTKSYIYFDFPGYISNKDLFNFINNDFKIKKGSLLNGKTKMDADNYYVFAKDMKPVTQLINIFSKF